MNPAKKPFRLNPILIVLILGLVAFIFYIYFFINPAQVISILSKTNLAIYAGAFVAYFIVCFFLFIGLATTTKQLIHKNKQTQKPCSSRG